MINQQMKFIIFFLAMIVAYSCGPARRVSRSSYENMVLIQGGPFTMGMDSAQLKDAMSRYKMSARLFSGELPAHQAVLQPFYIDKTEVSNAEFKEFADANPKWLKANIPDSLHNGDYLKDWNNNQYPEGKANHPVVYVSWYAAMAYAGWKGKRLPTEAEWELAAKDGREQSIQFPWGNDLPDSTRVNFANKIGHAVAVASYRPNKSGIYDLAGNVWEYCLDVWDNDAYKKHARNNPLSGNKDSLLLFYTAQKKRVVIRGGSWGGSTVNLRVTYRDSHLPTGAGNHVGFRCVKPVSGQ